MPRAMNDVTVGQRLLLVVVNLSTGVDPKYERLYEWLNSMAILVPKIVLSNLYSEIVILDGEDVTACRFVDLVVASAQRPEIRVLDVFLHLHGIEGALCFCDGTFASSDLGTQFRDAKIRRKLRLLYSTACYGATHAEDFVKGGFRVASGARGINANGMYDYPVELTCWSNGDTYQCAVKRGNNPLGLQLSKIAAAMLGFDDDKVDSTKTVVGRVTTRITTEAD